MINTQQLEDRFMSIADNTSEEELYHTLAHSFSNIESFFLEDHDDILIDHYESFTNDEIIAIMIEYYNMYCTSYDWRLPIIETKGNIHNVYPLLLAQHDFKERFVKMKCWYFSNHKIEKGTIVHTYLTKFMFDNDRLPTMPITTEHQEYLDANLKLNVLSESPFIGHLESYMLADHSFAYQDQSSEHDALRCEETFDFITQLDWLCNLYSFNTKETCTLSMFVTEKEVQKKVLEWSKQFSKPFTNLHTLITMFDE